MVQAEPDLVRRPIVVACLELVGEAELGMLGGLLVVEAADERAPRRMTRITGSISSATSAKSGTTAAREPPSGLKSTVVRRFVCDQTRTPPRMNRPLRRTDTVTTPSLPTDASP